MGEGASQTGHHGDSVHSHPLTQTPQLPVSETPGARCSAGCWVSQVLGESALGVSEKPLSPQPSWRTAFRCRGGSQTPSQCLSAFIQIETPGSWGAGREAPSHVLQHSSHWPHVALDYIEMKLKIQLPRALAVSSHLWLWAAGWAVQMEPILNITGSSMGQCCLGDAGWVSRVCVHVVPRL